VDEVVNDSANSNGETAEEPQYLAIPDGTKSAETSATNRLSTEVAGQPLATVDGQVVSDDLTVRLNPAPPASVFHWITFAGTALVAAGLIAVLVTVFFRGR
jgi:hypothetical protein